MTEGSDIVSGKEPSPGSKLPADLSCAVLGAGGFIGTNLCLALEGKVKVLRGLVRRRRAGTPVDALSQGELYAGDFGNEDVVRKVISGCDTVFHLIGSTTPATSNRNMIADIKENVVKTIRLLDLCVEEGVERVVFTSSGGTVYGIPKVIPTPEGSPTDPITSYGISKLAIEKYIALYRYHYDLDYRILRISNPYGPHQVERNEQGVVSAFLRRAISRTPVQIWGDGSVARDFIFIDDVVDAMIRAAQHVGDKRTMNIGSGAATRIADLIEVIGEVLGRSVEYIQLDARAVDVARSSLAITCAREELGWRPTTTLRTGLEKTISWMQRVPQTPGLISNGKQSIHPNRQQEYKK